MQLPFYLLDRVFISAISFFFKFNDDTPREREVPVAEMFRVCVCVCTLYAKVSHYFQTANISCPGTSRYGLGKKIVSQRARGEDKLIRASAARSRLPFADK